MLEVCPSIAGGKPSLEIHPLGIGGKTDPCRLVFDTAPGPAVGATLVDMGGRMRMIVSEHDVVKADHPLPKLPTARAVWIPRPDLKTSAEAWILAGGAHHTSFSQAADLRAHEGLRRDGRHRVHSHRQPAREIAALENELRWNDAAYRLRG